MSEQDLRAVTTRDGNSKAIVLIHGFSGGRDDTWANLPEYVAKKIPEWDVYTLGYATTLLPDIVGIWAADPDLPIVAKLVDTQLSIEPLDGYAEIALIAHSMGGLVVQKTLVDKPALAERVSHVLLFGTPSGGLKKAKWFKFWKRQLKNMSQGSPFVTALRAAWTTNFGDNGHFDFYTVAGDRDQFVPPESSLDPFPPETHKVVGGDHLEIVKPANDQTDSVRLIATALGAKGKEKLADEAKQAEAAFAAKAPPTTQKEVVRAAIELRLQDKRKEAKALLHEHKDLGTDVQGTLAGAYKRDYFGTNDSSDADHALLLYSEALKTAQAADDHDQIYYHAINVAFLHLVAYDDADEARAFAQVALDACDKADENLWTVATRAEANLYLGNYDEALGLYERVVATDDEPWKHASAGLQAGLVAVKLQDEELANRLEALFSPHTA